MQDHIGMVLDEMKIQANLVSKKHSGELIGFLGLGDPDVNFSVFEDEENLVGFRTTRLKALWCSYLDNFSF